MQFDGRGVFSPRGRIDCTAEQVKAHNAALTAAEIAALKQRGRGVLYLDLSGTNDARACTVETWDGGTKIPGRITRVSWHNMAGSRGRTDVDFDFDGSRWHGVNIGDNEILRVRRCKS